MDRIRWLPFSAVVFVCVVSASGACADVKLPSIFSDHMVLQQGMPVPVWGQASPGERVAVSLGRERGEATAGRDGRWLVRLPALRAGGPHELAVAGRNTIRLRDVLVGEVWLASGQSNMQFSVENAQNPKQEIAQASYPQIRTFNVALTAAVEPQADCRGEWVVCSPQAAGRSFSAVAYYFARELHRHLGVPVGIVHASWGGTRIQLWMDPATLAADPDLQPILGEAEKTLGEFTESFLTNDAPRVAAWAARAREEKASGRPLPLPPPLPRDPRVVTPDRGPTLSTSLYNAMIAPVARYGIRGAIWYQGESNAWEAYRYRKLFPAMIQGWRRAWGQGDFPFLFVQLANFGQPPGPSGPGDSTWAELREAQLMALAVPNTGMAVTVDIGEGQDIHPRNKQEVGRRLALLAGTLVYGWKGESSGPRYQSMSIEGGAIRLRFTHVGRGLVAAWGDKLQGFAVAGSDRRFLWADAAIAGDTVVVSSPQVPQPVAVRYAWGDDPPCNLYNLEGLPASPFRTDDWPGVTASRQ